MRKYKPPPRVKRSDPRNADEYIRDWVESIGSIREAGRVAGLSRTHLYVWLDDPDRRLSEIPMTNLARASGLPIEALVRRWTPIKDLDLWKWLRAHR